MTLIHDTVPARSLENVSVEAGHVRAAFGRFPSGVAALAADIDGEYVGLVASSFTVGVSYTPPLVMFSVQNSSSTWPVLRRAARIGVSILGSGHGAACLQLASRKGNRFAGLDVTTTDEGAVLIDNSVMWLDCSILTETPAGDHHIVVLEVKALSVEHDIAPLIYQGQQFHQLAAVS